MPIYEYRCDCGALLESLEKIGVAREHCGDLCVGNGAGQGKLARVYSTGLIRGDGREAKEPTFDPVKRANRPGGGCDEC